ncbi:Sodium channel protein para [Sarcoptes scabiei]|uniref:Sodium channel protein n=1 Tax=Sarcoptes scabiei TaxID=52283 RepID=A0A834RB50_SARSC|nr:Sodium channel protein para [Sarcoptes scabiei]
MSIRSDNLGEDKTATVSAVSISNEDSSLNDPNNCQNKFVKLSTTRPYRCDDDDDDHDEGHEENHRDRNHLQISSAHYRLPDHSNQSLSIDYQPSQPPSPSSSASPESSSQSNRRSSSDEDRRLSWLSYYGGVQDQNGGSGKLASGHHGPNNVPQPSQYSFKPFTRKSLAAIKERIVQEKIQKAQKESEIIYTHHAHHQEVPEPDPMLEAGLPLPRGLQRVFPKELIATPIEDIDRFYQNHLCNKCLVHSFPFNPIRRVAIYMLVHPLFSFLVIVTILINCILMTLPPEESIERTEIIFTTIYTFESCLKVAARGFILSPFTYLRDPWNWLDFAVITLAYLTMGATDLGNLSALRTFRVLRALKTMAIIPGMKTIVGAVIESVKNLKDVIILTCFSLSVFALLGLQVYMGVLTQKCVLDHPTSKNLSNEEWKLWCSNSSNWYYKTKESPPYLCGNSSQLCPPNYTCLQGFGDNPNYGYTNFDTFGWALLSSFRLMTQDSWETLYQMIIRVTGLWHMSFFVVVIFLGSFYLVNLILAIVAMSYDELQKKAEEEEEATAAEEAAYAEACRLAEEDMHGNDGNGGPRRSRRNSRLSAYNVASAVASAVIRPTDVYRSTLDVQRPSIASLRRYRQSITSLQVPHPTTYLGSISPNFTNFDSTSPNQLSNSLNERSIHKPSMNDAPLSSSLSSSSSSPSKSRSRSSALSSRCRSHFSYQTTASPSSSSSCSRSHGTLSSACQNYDCDCNQPATPPNRTDLCSREQIDSNFNDELDDETNGTEIPKSSKRRKINTNQQFLTDGRMIDDRNDLPFVDDSQAVTPTSDEFISRPPPQLSGSRQTQPNKTHQSSSPSSMRIVPYPTNLDTCPQGSLSFSHFEFEQKSPSFRSSIGALIAANSSSHNSTYSSHSSRFSYTSHGDVYTRLGFITNNQIEQQNRIDFPQNSSSLSPEPIGPDYRFNQSSQLFNTSIYNQQTNWSESIGKASDCLDRRKHCESIAIEQQPRSMRLTKSSDQRIASPPNLLNRDLMLLSDIVAQTSNQYDRPKPDDQVYIYYFPKNESLINHDDLDGVDGFDGCPTSRSTSPSSSSTMSSSSSSFSSSLSSSISSSSTSSSSSSDSEKRTFKESLQIGCLKCLDMLCVWDCFWCWIRVQELVALVVFDPFMELFITLCIVSNTLFMAMDHHNMDKDFENILQKGNYFFTAIFAIEAMMKLMALSPKFYFREGWNIFDFVIVVLSLLDVSLSSVSGLSVLRSFRLVSVVVVVHYFILSSDDLFLSIKLRVFKLAKSWPTLNLLISIMGKTIGDLGNLTFVLVIIIFIFAVMGMQLFGKNYTEESFGGKEIPRWNFKDFMHSFMIVFRVLCGEWIESMWDCMRVSGAACVPFFLATVVIGNLVVLNLFLALLLSSFGASNLSAPTSESADTKKLQEAFDRFSRGGKWIKHRTLSLLKRMSPKTRNQIRDQICDHSISYEEMLKTSNKIDQTSEIILVENEKNQQISPSISIPNANNMKATTILPNVNLEMVHLIQNQNDLNKINGESRSDVIKSIEVNGKLDAATADVVINEYPSECWPEPMYQYCPWCLDETTFWARWKTIRSKCYKIVEHKYFETLVITLILISSMALALEDVNFKKDPLFMEYLNYVDKFFTIIFICEMLIKWLAFGFYGYFTNVWCWLDFVIVMVSIMNIIVGIAGLGNIPAFKTMRTLRALRPLRALSRLDGMRVSVINLIATWFGVARIQAFKTMRTLRALRPLRALSRFQGMRVVVNALIQAIPAIFNVLLVCLIFWLIFSIMGVQLFLGKFYQCIDAKTKIRLNASYVPNKEACEARNHTIWYNPPINFDNVLNAYLALFQVATFKGWTDIMNNAIDSKQELDEQPEKEVNLYMYLYFVFFIIFGSFFTLNLFIGVIIDNFNEQKKKAGGSLEMFMTEDQKKYYNAMKKMGSKKPMKAIPRPRFKLQAIVFDVTTNKKFDMIIMLFIALNMFIMSMDEYRQNPTVSIILERLNLFFIAIFTAECLLKIFALRWHYFKEPWNVFDFVVVILSILGVLLRDIIAKYFVSPTLLRVVRVVKVGRVLRLVKGARGIRTLLFALAMSLPALFNICLLLFLVIFIYAIFGMSFFMNVKQRYGIDETFNFSTFSRSFILLFQMSTSAGWDHVLAAIMDENDCTPTGPENEGDCGNKGIAIAFLVSYLIISFLIIINMYIAVILENYSQAAEDVHEGLTDDDYDMYYEIWQKFDPKGTQFISYHQLSDFVHALEEPLQIPKPNKFKLISMDIPICVEDMCYCVDILDALTKDFFARKGHVIEETAELAEVAPMKLGQFEHISSTLWRQREVYCSKIIQKVWRDYLKRKKQFATNQSRLNTIEEES